MIFDTLYSMTGWFAMVAFYHCSPTVVSSSCFVYSPINYNLAKFPLTHRGELGLSPGGQIWVIIRGGAGAPGGRPRLSPSWLWEISLLVTLLLSCHDRLSRDTNNIQPTTNYQLPTATNNMNDSLQHTFIIIKTEREQIFQKLKQDFVAFSQPTVNHHDFLEL